MITSQSLRLRIFRTYALTLVVLALLTTASFFYSHYTYTQNALGPTVINIAGKQRMLSQRIALMNQMIRNSNSVNEQQYIKEQLKGVSLEFAESHEKLVGRKPINDELVKLPPTLKRLYFLEGEALDTQVKRYASNALMLAESNKDTPLAPYAISLHQASHILDRLDKAVALFESYYSAQLDHQQQSRLVAWLLSLALMIGSIIVLFKPLEKLVVEQFKQAKQAKAEARLERAHATKADQLKVQFLHKMGHEFRSPVSAIIGTLELLPNMREKQDILIKRAERSCYRLLDLVSNLVDILGNDNTSHTSNKQSFNLYELIDEAYSPFASLCRDKNIDLIFTCTTALPENILSYPESIRFAFISVLDNAVKYTEKGSVSVTVSADDNYLKITITDTGLGIPADQESTIFERFVQLENAINRRIPGTGVGLTLSREKLHQIGGEIHIASQLHIGSSFSLLIPFERAETTKPKTPIVKRLRVAVVDDLEISRLHIASLIQYEGFHVELFRSGVALMAESDRLSSFDVIVADYYMPGLDGVELATSVNAMLGKKAPAFIIVSAAPEMANMVAQSSLDIAHVFIKPIDKPRFIDALHQLATNRDFNNFSTADKHVLIVEDEPMNAEIVNNMVENLGYRCTLTRDGESALDAFKREAFDVVLLDINLPDLNGLEVARRMRSKQPNVPLIAVTGNAYEADKAASRAAGVRYHLVKPVPYQELKNTLTLAIAATPSSKAKS